MTSVVRSPKDFWIGLAYLGIGAVALFLGRGYPLGVGARMGPGYFPTVVASLLVLFGIVAIARSFLKRGEVVGPIAWKALALIVGATCLFALLLERAGLLVAIPVLVLVSAAASDRFALGWRPLAGLAALVAACALVFAVGLGLPIPLVGPWLRALSGS